MAYDAARQRTVRRVPTAVGTTHVGAQTWEWNGVDWAQGTTATQPSGRGQTALAFDSLRGRAVLFGGALFWGNNEAGDTWEFGAATPATCTAFGAGCAGVAGSPSLTAGASRPVLGQTLQVTMNGLPPNHSTLTGLGWSNTSFQASPLPADLGVLGAPGCALRISPDLTWPVFNWAGSANWALAIPNVPGLVAQGMRLASLYVAAPRCTLTRASFLTGVGAAKLYMTYVSEGGQERRVGQGGGRAADDAAVTTKLIPPASTTELPTDATTIAEVLHGAGYRSAHFGKWHVGRATPAAHGFDEHGGANSNQGPGRDPQPNPEQGTMITDRGLAFAKAGAAAGTPFYLQPSHRGGGSEDESRPESRQALAAELRGLRGESAW